jgi:uncharacterized membrane protein
MGNYVLLLVDSVNALYDTIADIIQWDFSFTEDEGRIRLLQILTVFTAGSVFGLVSLSHLLGYLLKRYRATTFATIIGFITGSLGVVWPWKTKVYELGASGQPLLDTNSIPIIKNYSRYLPQLDDISTWLGVFFIAFGISIVLYLVWVDNRNKTMSRG